MILVISTDYDQSTFDVIEWLLFLEEKVVLINEWNDIREIYYAQQNNIIEIKLQTRSNEKINFSDVKSIWYRRGRFYFVHECTDKNLIDFIKHDKKEWAEINDLLMDNLNEKFIIGNFFLRNINKNKVLQIAYKNGLLIPPTLITNNKASVVDYFKQNRIINKTIGDVIHLNKKGVVYNNRTIEISVASLPDTFYPSLFQKLIDKKYELRIFYINGSFFSSAIFSQRNPKTTIDFRNYDYKNPNRIVPYTLPKNIEHKLTNLMIELKLNIGAIDMIVSQDNSFYFLEVNPVGQFGMTSTPNNYQIEKRVANILKLKYNESINQFK